uniref:PACRG-like protein n=1 Tax=Globisporangium ultimum (strain ATCC 200006 / CBS 805.95 / DAOM BR144) TaxID=431595 RepID=K3X1T5_GLOUD
MKKEEAPAKKTSARSSSSSSSSSRSYDTPVASKQQKPETITARARKDIKTPPSGNPTTTASAPAGIAAKATKTHPLPSAALHKHKQAAVFTSGKRKHKTNFGSAYDSGSIPCRINHGSIKNALQWTKAPETLDFNPLLITCVEGFQEVEHPFVFLARTAFKDLMNTPDAGENAIAVLPQVIPPLRIALMAKEDDIFLTALEATRILSDAVENEMNVYLPKLTQQIHRKLLTKQLRAEVEDTLATLERNGGKEALAIIRSKIPTYVSVN